MSALLLFAGTAAGNAQAVHRISMDHDARKGEFRFSPSVVEARPGDILVFRAASGSPHSVVFEGGGLSAAAREAINSAMPSRSADLSSPLLTRDGLEYRMTVPRLAAGSYAFFCLPHRAYDMKGELRIR